tara:strand:- start:175 stop:441 length:267 start_codon:yes stop_codon:yes gene_type:complete
MSNGLLMQLLQEVRQMRHELKLVLNQLPTPSPWIPPRELASLLEVSTQTITAYRIQGRFGPDSIRSVQHGQRTDWEYHRTNAFQDIKS